MPGHEQLRFPGDAWRVTLSSRHDEWSTPQDLFDALHAEFGFTLDTCATAENAKCPQFFDRRRDGLSQPWTGVCFCNPPFGRALSRWVRKAYESARAGATVVMLIPARTDTRYWHSYVTKAAEVRFLKGRVKFGGAAAGAPFPSAVVVFRPDDRNWGEGPADVDHGQLALFSETARGAGEADLPEVRGPAVGEQKPECCGG
jgi:phage N-6-adenine-methyltransferase